jgi:hypothetical protein
MRLRREAGQGKGEQGDEDRRRDNGADAPANSFTREELPCAGRSVYLLH